MRCSLAWAGRFSRALAAIALVAAGIGAEPAAGKVFLSQEEALEIAFPDADRVERETYVLSDEQLQALQKHARAEFPNQIITVHRGYRDGELLGYAFIDVHTVRTLPEAFLVVLTPEGTVRTLRVLAFYEPLDYLPTGRWYEQFGGKDSEAPLRLGGDVHGIVGATLSARAATAGVRRALAVHELILNGAP